MRIRSTSLKVVDYFQTKLNSNSESFRGHLVRLKMLLLRPQRELMTSHDVGITSYFRTATILDPSFLIFPETPKTTIK